MKTLILSDTHLHSRVDQVLLDYILHLLSRVDRVILNGDFWDGYVCSFDQFLQSGWQQLFGALKKKETIYVLGNHDRVEFIDDRVSTFASLVRDEYSFIENGTRFHIEHGHRIAPEIDETKPLLTKYGKHFYPQIYCFLESQSRISKLMHAAFIEPKELRLDRQIANYIATKNTTSCDYYICGHSHVFKPEPIGAYYNSGVVRGNTASYLLLTDGIISPVTERYR